MVALRPGTVTPSVTAVADGLREKLHEWYEARRDPKGGTVHTNVMCAGLYVTEFLADAFPLLPDHYRTKSQVKGAGGAQAAKLLAEHGEHRKFRSEGGRTSRATLDHAQQIVDLLNAEGDALGVGSLTVLERGALAALLQKWFVDRAREDFFNRLRIEVPIDPSRPVRNTVADLLEAASKRGGTAAGAVAQHLVGAKLKLRFPDREINVESYTTADSQTGRAGDYQIGDTAIHVTMAPGSRVFEERCAENLRQGYLARVLVPDAALAAAVQNARIAGVGDLVAIQSIEDYVGTTVEEIGGMEQGGVRVQLRRLLEEYNARIDQAESDASLKIEIPENL
ncbi:DUF4928 family protein [Kitasatospora sp. NPDC059646]|uniref:DUF4928 family protein n=1 Tax=Kitasatospora sp. NPDC059646 TaxID=3346893 RepID=UPI0036BCCCA4